MSALASGCLVAALVVGARDLRRDGRRPAAMPAAVRWAAARYGRSRAGRRLAARLWCAQIPMSPAAWRVAQVLVAMPVCAVLVAAGMGPPAALAASSSAVRGGGATLLRLRRGAATAALDSAAPVLARALSTELQAWGSGAQAIAAASARCAGREPLVVSRVLQGAAARVVLGGDASTSLWRAVAAAAPRSSPRSEAVRVAAVFALHRHDSAATAAALEQLAASLEDGASVRREARAAVAEVRMSAVAVPGIAAATLAMLLASDPPALLAALSMPLCALLGSVVVVVVAASVGVRRMVSV